MGNSTKFIKNNILVISIVLLSSVLILIFSTQKVNYHIDELLTYSLSNSTSYINPVPGKEYQSYGEFQERYLAATDDIRFDYINVWRNQASDVHPPFYYVIVHTISSFMPDVFSKYIGIAVNILFNALIIILLYKFSLLLTNNDKNIAYIISLFWAFNPGVMSDMMFIRMYIMAMFFCLLISYVHIKYVDVATTRNYTFYISLFLVSLAGALTHYYFIVFNFFICALFVLFLLYRKKFKELFMYIGTYILTIISTLVIFPFVYKHIFGGESRGKESIDNFTNTEGYLQTVKVFWRMISDNLFGGYLLFFVIAIIISFIAILFFKERISKGSLASQSIYKIVFLVISCCFYFLLITNIAVYTVERYLQPIFPVIILAVVLLIFHAAKLFFTKKASLFIVCTLLVLSCITGYAKTTSFEYLKLDSEQAIQLAKQYSDNNSIYIYDRIWKIPTNYIELAHYNSVTLYDINDLDPLYQNTDYDEFVLYIHSADETIVNSIVEKLPNIEQYTKINSYGYSQVYYLE